MTLGPSELALHGRRIEMEPLRYDLHGPIVSQAAMPLKPVELCQVAHAAWRACTLTG
jgi:hypothetical protein